MPRVIALTECPVCSSGDSEQLELLGGARLRRCRGCSAVHAAEYADPSEVYVEGYFKGETDFGLDSAHPGFQAYLAGVAQQRMEHLERITRGPGRLLDVGAGMGEVMVGARVRGWTVQGVEPLAEAATATRETHGLDVITATLEESGLPERSFDAVTAYHVLEHIPEAREFLATMARWARPGGHVAVEVPNFDSALRRHTCSGWSGLRPLEHVTHFTPASLEDAFRRAGLEPVSVETPSYVGPPQSLEQALWDLGKPQWERFVAPLGSRRDNGGTRVPSALGWRVVHGMDAVSRRRGAGQVVVGIGRVPG